MDQYHLKPLQREVARPIWGLESESKRKFRINKNGGTLEKAEAMANHASTRMTQLYDRRRDEVSLDEVERIMI